MAQNTCKQVDELIASLSGSAPLRVWSVIITIFGDSILPRGGVVPATLLGEICGRLGIKPGALRVALFRLVKDGWLQRSMQGRNSSYALTNSGLAEFAPAAARIYAPSAGSQDDWVIVIPPPQEEDGIAGTPAGAACVMVLSSVYLCPAETKKSWPRDYLVLADAQANAPDWLRARLFPADLKAEFETLRGSLELTTQKLATGLQVTPLDAVTLRTLIIHQWRRLVLRQPDLPRSLFPRDWPEEECRRLVLDLHTRLSEEAERWIDVHMQPYEER